MPKKPIKPFITYSDQINILTQKKQLNISDLSYAEGKLHDIGYYSLIDGYKDIFYIRFRLNIHYLSAYIHNFICFTESF